MSVIELLKERIPTGTVLPTPSQRSDFVVEQITAHEVILLIGAERTRLRITSQCFEAVLQALPTIGWMLIGAKHDTPDPETLDAVIQVHTNGVSAASYVAPILEHVKLAEIKRSHPARIRRIIQ